MFKNNIKELTRRIEAMQVQEERTTRCRNYFSSRDGYAAPVDETCRKAMADWCFKVADALELSRETVGIGMSFFDRYLSSGKGKSFEALENRSKFQLAAITSFYIAVKIYEPVQMGINLLVELCRGFYLESDILVMEKDILFSLEWRVSAPTPLDFVRHLLELLQESVNSSVSGIVLQNVQNLMDYATTEFYFSVCKPSVVGVGCLASSFNNINIFSLTEQAEFLDQLSQVMDDFRITSKDVFEVQQRLLSQSSPCKPTAYSKASSMSCCSNNNVMASYNVNDKASSPICVSHTARQA